MPSPSTSNVVPFRRRTREPASIALTVFDDGRVVVDARHTETRAEELREAITQLRFKLRHPYTC